ncbi:regulatory protein RecX [Actinomycetes bacterium KLBMP 9797]
MAGRRRGARSGRGWDAAPPRAAQKDHTTTRGIRRGQTDSAADQSDEAGDLGAGRRVGRAAEEPRDEGELAREICLRQLAVRPRTRAELGTAMARRGISEEVAAEVLDRYGEVGMIDDSAFARAWVSSRHHGRGLARRALASELRQRGVDGETVDEALEDLDPDTEAATARELVDRKLRTATGAPDAVFRRLVSMLARKGYAPGLAIRVVKDALAAQSAEAAEFADGVDADALADLEGPPPP